MLQHNCDEFCENEKYLYIHDILFKTLKSLKTYN